MKKCKTILSLLLVAVMLIVALPLTATAVTVTRIDEFRFVANWSAIALSSDVKIGVWLNNLKNANNGIGKGVMAAPDTEGWEVESIVGVYDLTSERWLQNDEYANLTHNNWLKIKVKLTDEENFAFNSNKSYSFPTYVNGRSTGGAPLDDYGNIEFALSSYKYLTGAQFTVPVPKLDGLCSDYVPTFTAPLNQANYMHYTYKWKKYSPNNPNYMTEITSFSDSSYVYRLDIDLTCDYDYDMPRVGDGFVLTLNGMDMNKYSYYYDSNHIYLSYDFTLIAPSFPDVKEGSWYYEAVMYCAQRGFVSGYANGKFGPGDNLKRQDFVMILARIAGANLDDYTDKASKFSDVKKGAYYTAAVNWAVDNGVIGGYSNGKFGVGDNITREQVATILYRYVGSPNVDNADSTLANFKDVQKISGFAKTPLAWAVQNGVIGGMSDGRIAPTEGASRAQIAVIIMRMDEQGMFKN